MSLLVDISNDYSIRFHFTPGFLDDGHDHPRHRVHRIGMGRIAIDDVARRGLNVRMAHEVGVASSRFRASTLTQDASCVDILP